MDYSAFAKSHRWKPVPPYVSRSEKFNPNGDESESLSGTWHEGIRGFPQARASGTTPATRRASVQLTPRTAENGGDRLESTVADLFQMSQHGVGNFRCSRCAAQVGAEHAARFEDGGHGFAHDRCCAG